MTFPPAFSGVRRGRRIWLAAALAVLVWAPGCATDEPSSPTADPAARVSEVTVTGRHLYETYCMSCHGAEARGDGPVNAVLTVPATDLTLLRERYDGAFPIDSIYSEIDGSDMTPAHGTNEMPVWGNIWGYDGDHAVPEEQVRERVNLLIEYLRSIQAAE